MTALLREWVLGIVAVSLLSAVAGTLAGDAKSGRILRLISALALFLTVALPLRDAGGFRPDLAFHEARLRYDDERTAAAAHTDELLRDVTGEALAAYARQRAAAYGIECEARFALTVRDGAAWPERCTIVAEKNADAQGLEALRRELMEAFALKEIEIVGR